MENSRQNAFVQIFDGPNQPLRLEKWPLPKKLGKGEVLAEIELATICRSDLHTVVGQRTEQVPCILGHEAVGRVVKVDEARQGLTFGDRVTWSIADSCGACPPCTKYHLPQKCRSLFKYGHAATSDGTGLNGCYASHIVLRQGTHIIKVPDSLPDNVVAPANCALATVVNAVSRLPDSCHVVVVQGAGLLGLYACAMLRERGVVHVFCVDILEQRLAQVPLFGGVAIDGRPEHYAQSREHILAVSKHGVDAVLEVAGVAAVVPEGVRLLRSGGYYGFVGMVHPHTQLKLTGEQVIRKCLTIYGIHNYAPWHLDQAIQFLEKTVAKYPYESLVSPPLSLVDLSDGFQMARAQKWCRVSIRPDLVEES
jgi:putative phosphonate catabolism associated alcohol dehydrogenase